MNYTEIVAVLLSTRTCTWRKNGSDCRLSQRKELWTASKVPEMIVILFSSSVRSRSWSVADRRRYFASARDKPRSVLL